MYTVSRNGETMGPWPIDEIARKLAATELSVTDFVWDAAADDWTPLLDFSPLRAHLQAQKPGRPAIASELASEKRPAAEKSIESTVKKIQAGDVSEAKAVGTEERPEWYVSRGQQKFGPFTYFGVIKALQNKAVYEFDYIWTNGMESWVRIAEHERFGSETIRELMKSAEGAAIFAQRKHARILIENDVLVHDNNSVSQGRMVEASEGGSGLVIRNSTLIPGQMVNVHFSSLEGLPAFNAIGEVVSKKYAKGARDRRAPIHYGVRFVKMDQRASERVREFLKDKTGRTAA